MSHSALGRETILAVGAACGEPVRRALDELLDIFQRQVERDHAHELAEEILALRATVPGLQARPPWKDGYDAALIVAACSIDPEVSSDE